MRRRFGSVLAVIRNSGLIFCMLALLLSMSVRRSVAVADEANSAALLKQQLQTGEFAPALKTAEASAPADRNAILAMVAQAQASAGDHQAALQTVSQIDDDRTMSDSLAAVRSEPLVHPDHFGGNQADFDQLIDLITSTIAPASWDEMGGPGTISGYPGGVYIDAHGVVRPLLKVDRSAGLAELRQISVQQSGSRDARQASHLRKISLVRLERQVELLAAEGKRPSEEMQTLGGLQRIQYVLVYPEQGDIVLAGPAGDWRMDREGRLVSTESSRPVLRLDDLVVILRRMMSGSEAPFGCNITPTVASLGDVKTFVSESNKAPLKPGQRDGWLKQLREKLGQQNVEVYGIDPRTRVAEVLVEADYRMKLVGMGLEEGVYGVPSYLDMIELAPGQSPPPMDVLRWWFTLKYDAVTATPQHDAFELRGQGVQVLSENEMLTATGQQVHTGNSDVLNQQFARNFTKYFADLAVKYPIYAELQNMCDMALACALLRSENLPDKVRWHMLNFGDPEQYQVPVANAPKAVDTVINHRIVNKTTIIVGVSGGVRIDPKAQVKAAALKTDDYVLPSVRLHDAPKKDDDGRHRWWWD